MAEGVRFLLFRHFKFISSSNFLSGKNFNNTKLHLEFIKWNELVNKTNCGSTLTKQTYNVMLGTVH